MIRLCPTTVNRCRWLNQSCRAVLIRSKTSPKRSSRKSLRKSSRKSLRKSSRKSSMSLSQRTATMTSRRPLYYRTKFYVHRRRTTESRSARSYAIDSCSRNAFPAAAWAWFTKHWIDGWRKPDQSVPGSRSRYCRRSFRKALPRCVHCSRKPPKDAA